MNGENCANIADLISWGNGSGWGGGWNWYTVVTWSNWTRCTFEDWKFNCNNATPAWWDLDVRWDNGKRCKYVCEKNVSNWNITCWIQCLADAPTGWSGNSVTIWGDSGKICTKVNDTEIECNLDADSLWWSTTINTPSWSWISIGWTDWYLCTKNGSTSLKCTINPATLWSWWESLWKETTKNIYNWISYSNTNVLTPKNSTPLYFNTAFYHDTAFNFYTYQWSQWGWPSTRVTFNQKWIRIWNWNQFFSWAWISVAWTIAAWNTAQNNYIYIYTTWTANDPDLRYEIFGSRKLAIGTSSGSYIYFMEKDGTTNAYRVGINNTDPKATLDVKGWIRVSSNCEQQTCTLDRVGTILYHASKWFVWCKKVGTSYKRVSLDGWTWSGTTLWMDTNCQISIYSNPSLYIMNNTTATQ